MEHNPYQTPTADIEGVTDDKRANAELIRKENINHEAAIRSVGILYYVATVVLLLAAVAQVIVFVADNETVGSEWILLVGFFGVLAAIYYWLGSGLRALRRNVRIVAGVFAALGLLSFPVGTLINGYILYLLFSAKGKLVFSEEYQAVVDATPHIKYKTSAIIWILVGVLLLGVVAAIVVPMLTK